MVPPFYFRPFFAFTFGLALAFALGFAFAFAIAFFAAGLVFATAFLEGFAAGFAGLWVLPRLGWREERRAVGALKGLGFSWRNASLRGNTTATDADENRLIVSYTLSLL